MTNLQDLKAIGLSGPFNVSKLLFRVVVGIDGKYHFTKHDRTLLPPSPPFEKKLAGEVFEKIADCCQDASSWKHYSPANPRREASQVSAAFILKMRKSIIEVLTESERLKKASADSLTVVKSLEDFYFRAHPNLQSALTNDAMFCLDWSQEYTSKFEEEVARRVELFDKEKTDSFLEWFGKKAFIMTAQHTLDPETTRILQAGHDAMVSYLAKSKDLYLINRRARTGRSSAFMTAVRRIYAPHYDPKSTSNLMVLPAVIAQAEFKQNPDAECLKLARPISEQTLEALRTLYDPAGDGAYNDLSATLAAARLL